MDCPHVDNGTYSLSNGDTRGYTCISYRGVDRAASA